MESKTLKGVFPSPKKTPKRDFLKENILQVKNLKKNSRESIQSCTAAFKRSVQVKLRDRDSIKRDREALLKSRCSTSVPNSNPETLVNEEQSDQFNDEKEETKSQRSQKSENTITRNIASAISVSSSTCDQYSQTGDVNDEFFLKNTIIRYPTEFETKTMEPSNDDLDGNVEIIGDHIDNFRKKKRPFFGGRFQEEPDEFTHRMDQHVTDLCEFLSNGSITRNKIAKQKRQIALQNMVLDNQKRQQRLNSRRNNTTHFPEHYEEAENNENKDVKNECVPVASSDFNDNNVNDDNRSKYSDLDFYETNQKMYDLKDSKQYNSNSQKSIALKSQAVPVKKVNFKNGPNAPPPNYKVGEVPRYLAERKQEIQKQQETMRNEDPHCPEGHFVLPNEDRLKSLEMAENKYKLLVDELNRMPLTSATMKIHHRKMEIEKELNKLDETIRIFKRTKVYVKIDD